MDDHNGSQPGTGWSSGLLFGRERERNHLRHALDGALRGHASLILISGEAGIGKTTLVNDLMAQAAHQGALVLSGHSYDLTITPPYGPWVEIIETYEERGVLPRLPDSLATADAFEALQDRAALFREIRNFITAVTTERPLVIVLEDLHWTDQASLDLLRYLGRRTVQAQRMLIVATYRDDEVTRTQALYQLLPVIVREAQAVRVELQRLELDAVQEMVQSRYQLNPPDEARLVAYLHKQAEGNPLYLGELIRSIETDAVLCLGQDTWTLAELRHTRTPPLVRQLIERRLEKVTSQARSLFELAAIIGQTVSFPLWLAVSGASQDDLDRIVLEGVEAHVLEETPDGTQLRFTHALVRETIYQGVMLPRRRAQHLLVAEALAVTPSIPAGIIAYHFQQAGDEQALQWLIKAGEDAFRSWAWIEAAERYSEAIAFVENREDMLHERAWLALKLAIVLRESSPREAITYCEDALWAAQRLNDNALEALATYSLGEIRFFIGGNGLPEVTRGNEALQNLPPEDVSRLKHYFRRVDIEHCVTSIVLAQSVVGHYQDALVGARAYLARGQPQVDFLWPEQGHAEVACAYALNALGKPAEAHLAFRRAQECYLRADMVWFCAQATSFEMQYLTLAYNTDDLNERQRLATEIEHFWIQASGVLIHLPPRYGLLPSLFVEGNWHEARELALPFANRDVMHHDAGLWALGVIARHQGDTQFAWDIVLTVFPDGPQTNAGSMPMNFTLEVLKLAAEMALDEGDVPSAEKWIHTYDQWINLGGRVLGRAEGLLLHAQLHLALGKHDAAHKAALEALACASEPRQPLALVAPHRFLGELELKSGKRTSAEQHLLQALDLATACAAPYERALTLIAIAELRVISGQAHDAISVLNDARAICEQLGAKPALARLEKLSERFTKEPRSLPGFPSGLTAREVDVLRLVADGLSDAEVAERLYIARRTVTSHLTSIYTKLGVSSRAAATRFAVEQGLTTPSA